MTPHDRSRPRRWPLALAVAAGVLTLHLLRQRAARAQRLRQGVARSLHRIRGGGAGHLHYRYRLGPTAHPGAVVCVHGWGVSGAYFVPLAERIAAFADVYVPDLPGHGRTPATAAPPSVAAHADALLEWMDALGIGSAVLVGQSMGCQVAVEAALRAPDRIGRLVLVGPVPDPAGRGLLRQLGRLLASAPFERPGLIPPLLRDYLGMAPRLLAEYRAMLAYPLERQLARLALPTLLVRGQHDRLVPPDWFAAAAHLARAQAAIVVPGAGHAAHHGTPERMLDLLAEADPDWYRLPRAQPRPAPPSAAASPPARCDPGPA